MKNKNLDPMKLTEEQKLDVLLGSVEVAANPLDWLSVYNQLHRITYNYKTDSVYVNGEAGEYDVYTAGLRITAKRKGVAKYLNKQVIEDAVKLWFTREKEDYIQKLRVAFSFARAKTNPIQDWVQAATGKADKLDVAVMKHFVWQIRRKIYGLKVDHHMMPILFGRTGGGKSEAVKRMLQPLDDLTYNSDLSIFSDQFKSRFFTRFYVMFFDEMAKSERTDVDKLKNVITSDIIDFRIMHSEKNQSGPQNCTFIGCSNDAVQDKIYDPTSARRYWQINCSDKLNWKLINNIDYRSFWTCIDEKMPSPILAVLKEVGSVQDKEIRHRDTIEDWAERTLVPFGAAEKTEPLSSTDLYEFFKSWCEWQKTNNLPTFQKFSKRIKTIMKDHWQLVSTRTGKGTMWRVSCRHGNKGRSLEDMELISAEVVGDEEALMEIKEKHQQRIDVIDARLRTAEEAKKIAERKKNKWKTPKRTKEQQEQMAKDQKVLSKEKEDRAKRSKS